MFEDVCFQVENTGVPCYDKYFELALITSTVTIMLSQLKDVQIFL